jgi:hypothetical protein
VREAGGLGVTGTVDGELSAFGRPALFGTLGIDAPPRRRMTGLKPAFRSAAAFSAGRYSSIGCGRKRRLLWLSCARSD